MSMTDEFDKLMEELIKEEKKEEEQKQPEKSKVKEEKKEEKKEVKEQPKEEKVKVSNILPKDVNQITEPGTSAQEAVIVVKKEKKEEPVVQESFEIREMTTPAKEVYLIFGEKGTGKTMVAFDFPGKIACLSLDKKSAIIKDVHYSNDKRIQIFDGVQYMDYSSQEKVVESADKTYRYILAILDYLATPENRPDWIVIDGSEILQQICEWTMRYQHGIKAFEGIKNLNLWKERGTNLRQIHNKAFNVAKKGVIYTTYTQKDEIVIDGHLITKKDVPKWIDILVTETDYVIKTEQDPIERKFMVRIITSKNDKKLKSGMMYDVTDKRFWDVIRNE